MKKEKNLALIYSAVGHALMHMFAAFYFVIVLAIEKVWLLPYEELLKLWVLGSLLVGVAAIPAGWLSDRWSRSGMMLVMFLGTINNPSNSYWMIDSAEKSQKSQSYKKCSLVITNSTKQRRNA